MTILRHFKLDYGYFSCVNTKKCTSRIRLTVPFGQNFFSEIIKPYNLECPSIKEKSENIKITKSKEPNYSAHPNMITSTVSIESKIANFSVDRETSSNEMESLTAMIAKF